MTYKHIIFDIKTLDVQPEAVSHSLQVLKNRGYQVHTKQLFSMQDLEQISSSPGDTLYITTNLPDIPDLAVGIALWTRIPPKHIVADYYFFEPKDILYTLEQNEIPYEHLPWLEIAMELQFIAQAGITYSKEHFDLERFERIREISADIVQRHTDLSTEKVTDLFCSETGFQTPKLDTRAAIFKDNKILLVQETNGKWSLPGGWVDVNQSVKSNTIKEVKEESGLDVAATRLIALHDRNKHNTPLYAHGICKVFILCEIIGGQFEANIETLCSDYFSLDNLPPMALEKNTPEQVEMCFEAYADPNWKPFFD